jgi:glucose/arabinose dehydrogenase
MSIRGCTRSARTWWRKPSFSIYALSSHVAPLGLVFYTATNLSEVYRGGAFVGEHGSWNRRRVRAV